MKKSTKGFLWGIGAAVAGFLAYALLKEPENAHTKEEEEAERRKEYFERRKAVIREKAAAKAAEAAVITTEETITEDQQTEPASEADFADIPVADTPDEAETLETSDLTDPVLGEAQEDTAGFNEHQD